MLSYNADGSGITRNSPEFDREAWVVRYKPDRFPQDVRRGGEWVEAPPIPGWDVVGYTPDYVRDHLWNHPQVVWWYDDGTLGRTHHTGHGEVALWNTSVLPRAPPQWRQLEVITKEGSVRFEGDSKKNWILVKIYTLGPVENGRYEKWRHFHVLDWVGRRRTPIYGTVAGRAEPRLLFGDRAGGSSCGK